MTSTNANAMTVQMISFASGRIGFFAVTLVAAPTRSEIMVAA
jgi:hypothetical protein